jgi:hypothetical protein
VTHFARDYRKGLALFSGPCRFNSRIQRQDVGLERDAVDDADDVIDKPSFNRYSLFVIGTLLRTAPLLG